MVKQNHVHNNFFLKTFQDTVNTKDFILGILPMEITKKLDFSTLEIEDGTYVDEQLKTHLSDLTVKVKTKDEKPVDLYFLFEHKSYNDKTILWQLLKYQFYMFEKDYNEKKDFRTIIPIVFYHGQAKWNINKKFSVFAGVPEYFRKYMLNFEYILYDTKHFDSSQDEKFGSNAYLMSALSLMKNIKGMSIYNIEAFFQFLVSSGLSKKKHLIIILTEYLVRTNVVEEKKVLDIIKQELGSEGEDIMPSLAQKWLEQGRDQGIAEGIEKGIEKGAFLKAIETCKNALRSGIVPEIVSSITGLPLEKVIEIQKSLK